MKQQFTLKQQSAGKWKLNPIHNQEIEKKPSVQTMFFNPRSGDDPTPPNAVEGKLFNAVCLVEKTNAGFSDSPQWKDFHPCAIQLDCKIIETGNKRKFTKKVTLEFENPHENESMVIWTKIAKYQLSTEFDLMLIRNEFQEWDEKNQEWKSFDTKIMHTCGAESIMKSVLESSDTQQVAGSSTVKMDDILFKVGPFGQKARIILHYCSEDIYSYAKMSVKEGFEDFALKDLIPLGIFLPSAEIGNHKGNCRFDLTLEIPSKYSFLDIGENSKAYSSFRLDETLGSHNQVILLKDNFLEGPTSQMFSFHSNCLPFTSVLFVLVLEVSTLDFIQEPKSDFLTLTYLENSEFEMELMKSHYPGMSTVSKLSKVRLNLPKNVKCELERKPRAIINIHVSDCSGSTGRMVNSKSMRSNFNFLLAARFLVHLESIPILLRESIISVNDVWAELFYVFSDRAEKEFSIFLKVGDFKDEAIVNMICSIALNDVGNAYRATRHPNTFTDSQALILQKVCRIVDEICSISDHGGTDYHIAFEQVYRGHKSVREEIFKLLGSDTYEKVSFLSFDTDGGHNYPYDSSYIQSIQRLVKEYEIRGGCVTGCGEWLNQYCASKVAKLLKGISVLTLHVPELSKLDQSRVFLRSEGSFWVECLRKSFHSIKIVPSSVIYSTKFGKRSESAVEILALKCASAGNVEFGNFDISKEDTTGIFINNLEAGSSYDLYCLFKANNNVVFDVLLNDQKLNSKFSRLNDELVGEMLGYDWIQTLSGNNQNILRNTSAISKKLFDRVLDDLSFNWNLPLPDGSTSFIGRMQSHSDRKAIDQNHFPDEPYFHNFSLEKSFTFSNAASTASGVLWNCTSSGSAPATGSSFSFGPALLSTRDLGARSLFAAQSNFQPHSGSSSFGMSAPSTSSFTFGSLSLNAANSQSQASCFGGSLHQSAANTRSNGFGVGEIVSRKPIWSDLAKALEIHSNQFESVRIALSYCFAKHLIKFICDKCKCVIDSSLRFHSYDLIDFDLCSRCFEQFQSESNLKEKVPVRFKQMSSNLKDTKPDVDPILNSLFAVRNSSTTTSAFDAQNEGFDRTFFIRMENIKSCFKSLVEWMSLLSLPSILEILESEQGLNLLNQINADFSRVNSREEWTAKGLDISRAQSFVVFLIERAF